MANEEHVERLRSGVAEWNAWRNASAERPDLRRADLSGADVSRADLSGAHLGGANLSHASLRDAHLGGANLTGVNLLYADLFYADLTDADLITANLIHTGLGHTRLARSRFGLTVLVGLDLRGALGLELAEHLAPSSVGVDTLYLSAGQIPEAFLRGCGVSDELIAYLPSLVGAEQAIRFYSCFISYSTKDEEFARRLYERLRAEHVRVWFAPEDIRGGEKLSEQLERAVELHDRLLLVLSDASIGSPWVMRELRKARRQEVTEKRRKLFPIALCSFSTLGEWRAEDSVTGTDLAEEVRQYFIPDFSDWKNHDAFEAGFARLLRDLRAEEQRQAARSRAE